jgi:hypothetical protein
MYNNLMPDVEKIFDVNNGVLMKLLEFMLAPAKTKANVVSFRLIYD